MNKALIIVYIVSLVVLTATSASAAQWHCILVTQIMAADDVKSNISIEDYTDIVVVDEPVDVLANSRAQYLMNQGYKCIRP